MNNLFNDDEWRPVKRWGLVIPQYYVNKKGEVLSTKGKQPKFLKPTVNKGKRWYKESKKSMFWFFNAFCNG